MSEQYIQSSNVYINRNTATWCSYLAHIFKPIRTNLSSVSESNANTNPAVSHHLYQQQGTVNWTCTTFHCIPQPHSRYGRPHCNHSRPSGTGSRPENTATIVFHI